MKTGNCYYTVYLHIFSSPFMNSLKIIGNLKPLNQKYNFNYDMPLFVMLKILNKMGYL